RDVGGAEVVLDRGQRFTLTGVCVSQRVRGLRRGRRLAALEQTLEDRTRGVPALVLAQEARMAKQCLRRPAWSGRVTWTVRVRVERAGAVTGGLARTGQREPGARRAGIARGGGDKLPERGPRT